MTALDAFDPSDRPRIAALPMLVGMAVTAADPGGLWGAIKESTAMASAITKAKAGETNPLISAAAENFASSEGRSAVSAILKDEVKGREPKAIVESLLAEIGRLAALIASKDPGAAAGYNAWLLDIAQNVAEAGTEGGFLGFGGVKVSADEAATLDRLRGVLAAQTA